MNWVLAIIKWLKGGSARQDWEAAARMYSGLARDLRSDFESMRGEISELKGRVTDLEREVAECHRERDAHKDTIRLLESQVSELNARLGMQ